jgi:hypothetical protein
MPVRASRARPTSPPAPEDVSAELAALRAERDRCRAQNTYLHGALARALQQAPLAPTDASTEDALRLEVADLRQRLAILTLHYQDAQAASANWQQQLAFAHKVLGWMPIEMRQMAFNPTAAVEDLLTRLLTVAHPDKWSQGQPATVLAHELTVAITALRQTLI